MLKWLLISLVLTGMTVLIHGVGTLYSVLHIAGIWNKKSYFCKALGVEMLVIRLVSYLLGLHLLEAGIWALWYYLCGAMPDFETAAYYSLTSYTTVGYGDVVLSNSWRLLGPIEAAVGILMMGWSTGIIVTVILKAYTSRLKLFLNEQQKS
jgi:hypothetical protein